MPGGRDWCINIVLIDPDDDSSEVTFQPDVPNSHPGDPLTASATDLVGWNNRTPNYHQPWQSDSSYKPLDDGALTNEIEPWQGSTAQYVVAAPSSGNTIYYICKNHPDEHGTIVVVA